MNWRRFRKVFWALADLKSQTRLRNWVPRHKGLEQQGLNSYQVYPEGGNLDRDFLIQPVDPISRFIRPDTPIASMGSCFALEIRARLRERNFNFIQAEESDTGSAQWGRVYTTKNMLQIFQYTFSEFLPEIRVARSSRGVFDPYREGIFYSTEDEAARSIADHVTRSRSALTDCEVLILTIGQNETWVCKSDGLAWAHKPPAELVETHGADFFDLKRFTLAENIEYLSETLRLFWTNNPSAKVIFTVSPVPSYATFYDVNVAVRSFENKANLLLAIKEVISQNPERCDYFPSFEMAMLSNNKALQLDNRHVRPTVVEGIMDSFDARFVIDGK